MNFTLPALVGIGFCFATGAGIGTLCGSAIAKDKPSSRKQFQPQKPSVEAVVILADLGAELLALLACVAGYAEDPALALMVGVMLMAHIVGVSAALTCWMVVMSDAPFNEL